MLYESVMSHINTKREMPDESQLSITKTPNHSLSGSLCLHELHKFCACVYASFVYA